MAEPSLQNRLRNMAMGTMPPGAIDWIQAPKYWLDSLEQWLVPTDNGRTACLASNLDRDHQPLLSIINHEKS